MFLSLDLGFKGLWCGVGWSLKSTCFLPVCRVLMRRIQNSCSPSLRNSCSLETAYIALTQSVRRECRAAASCMLSFALCRLSTVHPVKRRSLFLEPAGRRCNFCSSIIWIGISTLTSLLSPSSETWSSSAASAPTSENYPRSGEGLMSDPHGRRNESYQYQQSPVVRQQGDERTRKLWRHMLRVLARDG